MKTLLVSATALALLSGAAFAQDLVLAPEQRTVIKQYVTKEHVKPVTVKERLAVGATVPADVELSAVPETWGPSVSRYRYIYSGDHVVLVEPSSRKIIQIVE